MAQSGSGDLMRKRKICVLGSRAVGKSLSTSGLIIFLSKSSLHPSDALYTGKSSLIVQFVKGQFIEPYYPTIEQAYFKQVNYKNVEYDVSIIDTAGQDEYSLLSPKYAVGIHGYILVYSVNNRHSFDMVRIVYEKLKNFQVRGLVL